MPIEGSTLEDVVSVPRYAVHEGDTVWVVEDGMLRIRQASLARSDRTRILVESGLESGDVLVLSSLEAVTDGMRVRRIS